MAKAINSGTIDRPVAKATKIAAEFAAADEDWTYFIEDYGNGYAAVFAIDEDGDRIRINI